MKVGIQNKEGRLILVWNDGKRRTMPIGLSDAPPAHALVNREDAVLVVKTLGHSPGVLHENYAEVIESRSVINTLEGILDCGSGGGDRE